MDGEPTPTNVADLDPSRMKSDAYMRYKERAPEGEEGRAERRKATIDDMQRLYQRTR